MGPGAADFARTLRASMTRQAIAPWEFRSALAQILPADREGWLDVLWQTEDLPEDDPALPRGCVPYLPCPVATVLEALHVAGVGPQDVFVDVGSGLGRVVALARLWTGASCIGVEIQRGLVLEARARADQLQLDRVRFVEGDAAELIGSLAEGDVFFLYCPFGPQRLRRVLRDLAARARDRPIRVCCVGMADLGQPWLEPLAGVSEDLAVYRSR